MCSFPLFHRYIPGCLRVPRSIPLTNCQKGNVAKPTRTLSRCHGTTFQDKTALAAALKNKLSRKKRASSRTHIVSEELCNDIIQVLSPFITKSPPCDIIDYGPGVGMLSAAIHDFLQPRRHLLLEPDTEIYSPFLEQLTSRPSIALVSLSLTSSAPVDWHNVFAQYLPEQMSSPAGHKNDSLLLIANMTDRLSRRSHFTQIRLWDLFMEMCLQQSGFHKYGMVRILAMMSASDGEIIIPRTIAERKKTAVLTESVALHAFNVAETFGNRHWLGAKEWELVAASAARVSERIDELKIVVPEGRRQPPVLMAPETTDKGLKPVPHVPRTRRDIHQEYLDTLDSIDSLEKSSPPHGRPTDKLKNARLRLKKLLPQLNFDNRFWYRTKFLCDKQAAIDELEKSLQHAAADSNTNPQKARETGRDVDHMKTELVKLRAKEEVRITSRADLMTDERRATLRTGSFDGAVLLWDRRPIEPLYVHPNELFQNSTKSPWTMIYFEPSTNSPMVQTLREETEKKTLGENEESEYDVASRRKESVFELFAVIISAFGYRANFSVADFLTSMFPGRSTIDIIRAAPSLASFASPRLMVRDSNQPTQPGPAPTVQESLSREPAQQEEDQEKETKTNDKLECDYDFTNVRLRSLPFPVIWDLIREYIDWPFRPQTATQVNRALGGAMTAYNSGSDAFVYSAGKAAGKVHNI